MAGPGGTEVLAWGEAPDPRPGPGEVLIAVAATAVNRADIMQRQGHYAPPPDASPLLGLECSGTVVALGADVSGATVGDEVCALLAGGGYAELVAVPVGQVMPLPAGIDIVTAAALPEVTATVVSNIFGVAALVAGEALLVHGGSSGIGTMAIQLACHAGARVLTTAGSAYKLERCRELGADVVINYRDEDFVERVRVATDGRAVDVILDNMGAAYLARNIEALAADGRLVTIGLQGGTRGELDLGLLLTKRASVTATSLRGRPVEQKAAICADVVRQVWPAIADGSVRPVIDRVLPLAHAAQAHRVMEVGEHVGKIVLTLR